MEGDWVFCSHCEKIISEIRKHWRCKGCRRRYCELCKDIIDIEYRGFNCKYCTYKAGRRIISTEEVLKWLINRSGMSQDEIIEQIRQEMLDRGELLEDDDIEL